MTAPNLLSADSHVLEDVDLWQNRISDEFKSEAPSFPPHNSAAFASRPGGSDATKRTGEMEQDGVWGEVLYPSLTLDLFGLSDVKLQQECFRIYNDWLAEYCAIAPTRLFGVSAISAYDLDQGIEELHRCKDMGSAGAMLWQAPPAGLEFSTDYYDKFWAEAEKLAMPVSFHILTGPGFPSASATKLSDLVRKAVNDKLRDASNVVSDLITSGVFERFPELKVVLVENEVGWLPFVMGQLDKYAARKRWETPMNRTPTEYFETNVFATFFNDPTAQPFLGKFAPKNLMWSNDYPHQNSTWPDSKHVIERDLGHLDADTRHDLIAGNAMRLYGIDAVKF